MDKEARQALKIVTRHGGEWEIADKLGRYRQYLIDAGFDREVAEYLAYEYFDARIRPELEERAKPKKPKKKTKP